MKEEELKYELMKSFHEQFAQNQNHHQNLFIQVVSILLTVIIGFGYTMFNFNKAVSATEMSNIGLLEFTSAFTISEVILTLGIAIVSNMALGFRRDQLMNTRIREYAGITEITEADREKDESKIFTVSYNPMKNYYKKTDGLNKKILFDWMPNFHIIFSITFIVTQILVLIIFAAKIGLNPILIGLKNTEPFYSFFIFLLGCVSAFISSIIINKYHRKLKDFYLDNGMKDLINNRYSNG